MRLRWLYGAVVCFWLVQACGLAMHAHRLANDEYSHQDGRQPCHSQADRFSCLHGDCHKSPHNTPSPSGGKTDKDCAVCAAQAFGTLLTETVWLEPL